MKLSLEKLNKAAQKRTESQNSAGPNIHKKDRKKKKKNHSQRPQKAAVVFGN